MTAVCVRGERNSAFETPLPGPARASLLNSGRSRPGARQISAKMSASKKPLCCGQPQVKDK